MLSTVGGVQYRGGYHDAYEGYHDACGGYLEYRGNVQYRGGYHDKNIIKFDNGKTEMRFDLYIEPV